MRERIHGPANSDADKEEKDEGPQDVSGALVGAAAAEKPEGDRDHECKKHHGLKMAEPELVRWHHALRARMTS